MKKLAAMCLSFIGICQLVTGFAVSVTPDEKIPAFIAFIASGIGLTALGFVWRSQMKWKHIAEDTETDYQLAEKQNKELRQEKLIRDAVREETRRR